MIARFFSLLLLAYALGFILFSVTLGKPARDDAPKTDAVVVLTGGPNRIEHAAEVLEQGRGKRMFVSGVDPAVTKQDIVRRLDGKQRLVSCCIDLGSESVDTRSNAEEAQRWLDRQGYKSLRLITSDWHMRRARYEFRRVLGADFTMVTDAVRSEPSFLTLFGEYNKFVLRRIAVWADI